MLKSLLRGGVRRRSFGLRRIVGGTKPLILGHVHSRGSGIISYRRRLPVLGGGDGAAVVEDLLDERFRLLLQKLLLLARLGVGFGLVLFSSLDFGLRLRRRRGFDSGGGLMVVITVTHRVQLVALGGRLLFAVAAAVVLVVRIAARGRRQGLRRVRLLLFHWQFFLYRCNLSGRGCLLCCRVGDNLAPRGGSRHIQFWVTRRFRCLIGRLFIVMSLFGDGGQSSLMRRCNTLGIARGVFIMRVGIDRFSSNHR